MGTYFEDIHKATGVYPYIGPVEQSLNYITHFHEETEIVYVMDGCVNISCDSVEYKAGGKSIAIILPGVIHSFSSNEDNRLIIIKLPKIHISKEINLSLIKIEKPVFDETDPVFKRLSAMVEGMINENSKRNEGFEFAIASYCYSICCLIARDIPHYPLEAEGTLGKRRVLLNNVIHYITDNYASDISLDNVAKYCDYDKYYFAHMFREITGTTFNAYLTAYRLSVAADLLVKTDDNITDITFQSGFSSIRNFNSCFKRHFGMTPGEFRKKK